MEPLSTENVFRSLMRDRRTLMRVFGYVPGQVAAFWRGFDELALVCGHIQLFERGILDPRSVINMSREAMELVLARGTRFVERCLAAGCFDPSRWRCSVTGSRILHVVRDPDLIPVLLGHGAPLARKNNFGHTPLQHAIQYNWSLSAARCSAALLDAGADASDLDGIGISRPQRALARVLERCGEGEEGGREELHRMIECEQLLVAAGEGDLTRLRELVEGAGVDPTGPLCQSAMIYDPLSASMDDLSGRCAEYLLARGAKIRPTLLMAALRHRNLQALIHILERPVDEFRVMLTPFAQQCYCDDWIQRCLQLALEDPRAARAVLQDALPYRDLVEAAARGDVRAVNRLMDAGIDPTDTRASVQVSHLVFNALQQACCMGHFRVTEALLRADWSHVVKDRALEVACRACDMRSALLLVAAGAAVAGDVHDAVSATPAFHGALKAAMDLCGAHEEEGLRRLAEMCGMRM